MRNFSIQLFVLAASITWQLVAADTWTLQTDDTSAVITVESDRPVLNTLGSVSGTHNWLPAGAAQTLLTDISHQGTASTVRWRFRGGVYDRATGELTLTFENADPALELHSVWRARPGHGPIEHWMTITNRSPGPITVGHQDSLALAGIIPPAGRPAEVWWINRGGSNASSQGGVFREKLSPEFDQVLLSNPTDPSSPVPWTAIQSGESEGLYAGWEFSGVGRIHVGHRDVRVGYVPEFKTDLPAGQTFLVPPAFIGCYKGDVEEGSYALHRFVLEKLLPPLPKDQPFPTLAYNLYLDSGGEKATEADVLRSAATAKDLGFETFVPDAMWFPQAGDWRWNPTRFPHSSRAIEQFVHENGMRFGVWLAWTQGGSSDDPQALNIRQHPDWFTRNIKPDEKLGYLHWDALIDLGDDPAREWAERTTERIVAEQKIDYLKHDFSPIATQCVETNHRHHYGVDVSYWSTMGYYEVQEKLKQKFPDLVLEGCSGGGHIKDFGYIRRVHYIVTTDTLSALPDRQSIYDSTFALPPAVLQAYTYENQYNHDADLPRPYLWRSAMMSAWQIDPTKTADWTPEERANARKCASVYKTWIRGILRDAKVHHILPRPDGYHWDGMFYWSPSLKRGTVYIFRPNNDQSSERVRLKGLDAAKTYRVWSEDGGAAKESLSGTQLMSAGLRISLPSKFSSDLIYVEERR